MTSLNGTTKITEEQIQDILYCSRTGELNEIKEILGERESYDEILKECQDINESKNSPLHYSSANGHLEIVKELLEKCSLSSLISQNDSGNTPLHWASFNGQLEVVKVLIDRIEALAPLPTLNEKEEESLTEEEKDVRAEEQARQRSVWDVVNNAGRGPMSEAQMNNKEAVVDYMLQRMVTAPTGAPSDEPVPDQDTNKPAESSIEQTEGITEKAQDLSLENGEK